MRILSLLILNVVFVFSGRQTDSPHGADFKISCNKCHSSSGWQLDRKIYSFDHNTTKLPLVGQHTDVGCRQCHPTLVFRDARTECNECHNDVHQATVGSDCARCHTPASWLVNNITEIHQISRFPLIGAHKTADCSDCHKSESPVRFDVPGINCIDCHREDYNSASNPNHVQAGFPEDCLICHHITSFQWTDSEFNHNMFPLEQGHSSVQCSECHKTGNYSDAARECYSCHQQDYTNAAEPDHDASLLPVNCEECHTLAPGWQPTTFDHSSFPLTFGHSGPSCIECHIGGNYSNTSSDCFSCHQTDYENSANPDHQSAGFTNVCLTCHTTNPGWTPTTFTHTKFPLDLGHSTPECIDCHIGENYTTTPTDCYGCHQPDYTSATDPNHVTAGFPQDCQVCHTVNPGWTPSSFDHSSFPLTLGHSTPLCADCHTGGNYTTTQTDCYSCHQTDFNSTSDPNHTAAGFSQVCQTCHTTNPGWQPTTFNHSSFALTLGHSTPACIDCHVGENYTTTPTDCYGCHQPDYNSASDPNHIAAAFPQVCQTCHSTNPGWQPTTYNHNSFPLTLGHSIPACADCHTGGNYTTTPTDCYSCHQTDYSSTSDPNHTAAGFSQVCQTCHTTNPGWQPTTFNHSSFSLTLGHSTPACIDCHVGENYTTTPTDCYGCHQPDYNSASDPNHIAAAFPQVCQTCHSTNPGWQPTTYNHNSFPLTLGHSTPLCADCHTGGNYTTTPTECYSCHQTDYSSTSDPNHTAAGFSQVCQTCHTTNPGWQPTTYNHSSFALTLGHSTPSCIDCHVGENYTTTPTDCYDCHQPDYTSATDPNHVTAGFPQDCQICHTVNPGWQPASFDHTSFPLTMGHSTPACADCHTGGNYTTTPTDCYSCHQTDYSSTSDPNHTAAGFSQVCQTCHTTNPGWQPTTFNHSSFALTLGHSTPACIDCHVGENYTTTPTDCYGCHQPDYNSASDPNHIAAAFPQVCQTCHSTNPGWQPTTYNHNSFPLTLGHSIPACADCHTGGNYTTTPTDCYSCHQTDYSSTSDPNHTAAGFSQVCQTCHTTNPGWQPTTFNHSSFSLTLGHSTPACIDCHVGENYTTTPTDCYGCHQTDYTSATDPNHVTSGFPQDCQVCHTVNPGWQPTTYNHTSFPLTLGHSTPLCADCHTGGNYTTTPTDCYSCHQTDFNSTSDPNHTAAGFSQVCQTCHSTNPGWKPASFLQHDALYFPVYSGKHSNEWNSCSDCHANSSNYNLYSCITCHEHNKTDMDDAHSGRPGYSYNSIACYQCHPRGVSD